jgi:hypothetical protein
MNDQSLFYLCVRSQENTGSNPCGKETAPKGAHSDVRPLQKPHPLLFFGGTSDGAPAMGARLCDVYAIYAEPLASARERITQFRAQAAAFGRTGLQCLGSPDYCGQLSGRLGRGGEDPCSHDRQERLESAGDCDPLTMPGAG